MNNTFSLEQITKTSKFDSKLILRHYKLDLMATFMDIKSGNPKLRQDLKAKKLGCSGCTLQRNRHDVNLLSLSKRSTKCYKRGQKILNTNLDDNSNRQNDLRRLQKTPKESVIDSGNSN